MAWLLFLLVYFGTPLVLDVLGGLSWARVFGGYGYEIWIDGEADPMPPDTILKMFSGVLHTLGKKHWWTRRLPAPFLGVRWALATLSWPLWLDLRLEAYQRVRSMSIEDIDFSEGS